MVFFECPLLSRETDLRVLADPVAKTVELAAAAANVVRAYMEELSAPSGGAKGPPGGAEGSVVEPRQEPKSF